MMENYRRYFPLSVDQNVVLAWAGAAPSNLLNLAVRIDIDDEIEERLFLEALKITVNRLHYCRVRLHNMENGTTVQYESDMDEQVLPDAFLDCSSWEESKISRQLSKWAGAAFPNKMRDVQLFHAELMRLKDNRHCLFFCGHHIIMDIYAVVFFVSYVDKVYYALLTNSQLPKEGASPEEVVLKRNSYLASEKYKKDYGWWREEFSSEPLFTSINGLGGKEFIDGKRYGHDRNILQMVAKEKVLNIPSELEKAVTGLSKEKNCSPNMIYCLAIRCFLSSVCNIEDVSFQMLISLRASLAQKSAGLTFAEGVSFRGYFSNEISFCEALNIMDSNDKNYLRHIELPDPNQQVKEFFGCPRDCNYHSVTVSYVPFVDFDSIHLNVHASKIDSGIAITPVYILLMHTAKNESMKAIYQYSAGYVKPENIDRMHAFMLKFLELGIANPDKKIDELIRESSCFVKQGYILRKSDA